MPISSTGASSNGEQEASVGGSSRYACSSISRMAHACAYFPHINTSPKYFILAFLISYILTHIYHLIYFLPPFHTAEVAYLTVWWPAFGMWPARLARRATWALSPFFILFATYVGEEMGEGWRKGGRIYKCEIGLLVCALLYKMKLRLLIHPCLYFHPSLPPTLFLPGPV